MAVFSKPSTDIPAAIQAVIEPVTRSSHASNKKRIFATTAIIFLAYITNHLYRKQLEAQRNLSSHSPNRNQTIPDGPVSGNSKYTITIPYRNRTTNVTIFPTKPETFVKHKHAFTALDVNIQRVGVNKTFFRQLLALLKIIIPKFRSKEIFILLLHSSFLVLRTYLSVVVARLDGRIVRDLVAANGQEFVKGLGYWFAIAIPAVYTNSMIRFLQSKLSIAFRTRLTRYVHDLYLDDKNAYYKIINLDGRIDGADQFITTDISRFCDGLASIYSNLGKPILDTIIFNYALTKSIGLAGMLGIFSNYMITARLLRAVTPAFGKLAAIEAKLEGDFRSVHTRLITNAEEIAFYNGADLEHSILDRTYMRLIKHINSVLKIRIAYNMFEDFIVKYFWSTVGLLMCALPVFYPEWGGRGGRSELEGGSASDGKERDRTKAFITNKRIMITLADAGGRMMYSYKELAELAGHTSRVYSLLSVLHSLHANQYTSVPRPDSLGPEETFYSLDDVRGIIDYGFNGIKFENVPIVAPNPGNDRGGEEFIKGLNVTVNPGEHLLITGPNGVGKTSIARVISTLWPVFRGRLARPNVGDIFYIPQRPYLSIGTLRDQLIYPHSHADMIRAGRTDNELIEILDHVHLGYILNREGGWDTKKEWKDVFSGGEKQRIGVCRLFYHHPKFAILDECTSAVSSDVEGLMYQHAKDVGITLITISHRPALTKYHTHLLRVTGEHGTWEFSTIGTPEERMSLEKELSALEEKIKDVEQMRERLADISRELQLGIANNDNKAKIQKRGLEV
ncbi:4247_t:CDS:10 [Ambispora gerdemannii]|uniref:4247_t:CDS:1 n=1 Tax=Ambispora gerdemannii TaxID=144530 RepID=A0A9N8ZU85_9GLOM|nr:4247_t:CDS:10 [Ambispora gerdemannii]